MRAQSCPMPRAKVEQLKLIPDRALPARIAALAIARKPVGRETIWPLQAFTKEAQVRRA